MHCDGIGLSDGEVMERMWSYLRRFCKMTKEMRPAHRIDVLSHALLYYGRRTKQKLGKVLFAQICRILRFLNVAALLTSRWRRAYEMNELAKQTMRSLCESLPGS